MPKLPRISGSEAVRILGRLEFFQVRQRGSHVILRHHDGRGCVVPLHRELKVGTLAGVLRQARVSAEKFLEAAA
jgi:predicted RNA binding protein YcfA (HicA-like mRNA interferase family)